MVRAVHTEFLEKLGRYKLFNYFIASFSIVEITLYLISLLMGMVCRQALPITIYNIGVQVMTLAMAIVCIVAVSYMKYFNTVLGYAIIVLSCKVIQIATFIAFNHQGTCLIPVKLRVTLGSLTLIELGCLIISTWILKRTRKVHREMKVESFIKTKQFLSD